ncbi:MAG: tRNA uridine-5-carboxymethylaminomethyl(34) synthesis GTPase MnmE [Christensenellaceae bacterium]|jgi:tRNA modification GTPase|nr:tRNA uridine-5-carboxymethylaminomethyl(34) synthesis GTPase MnmE [Christensenellaceae bacterium]
MSNSDKTDTIVAIATPRGNAGVGIIRLSGPKSLHIASEIANIRKEPRVANFVIINVGQIRDKAIAIYFKSPQSFTGEDIVELQCHGGALLLDKIVDALIKHGARLAKPGEFTRRALLNGKLSLTDAESLIDTIHAESDAELTVAGNSSELHVKTKSIEQELTGISAQIEACLDHPDEVTLDTILLKKQLNAFLKTLSLFTDAAQTSHYIYNGINVAILGEPNVGKSSLFNQLLGHDRSIVTEIAGTTTDLVSETMQVGGYKVRLTDTAGIRDGAGKIEKLGIEKSLRVACDCDIALVFDDTALKLVKDKPYICVTRNSSIDTLKKQIIEKTIGILPKLQSRAVANTRQINELVCAKIAIESALKNTAADLLASDIQTALYHISNITGTNASEAVLDEIFSRFCLGK